MSMLNTDVLSWTYFVQGGLKAVLWTDTFQIGVMFAGLFAIVTKGMSDVGGLKEAWNNFDASGRVEWDEYVTNNYLLLPSMYTAQINCRCLYETFKLPFTLAIQI